MIYGPGAPNVIITLKFCIQCQRNKWSILTAPNCCCQRPQPTSSNQALIHHTFITIEQAQWQSLELINKSTSFTHTIKQPFSTFRRHSLIITDHPDFALQKHNNCTIKMTDHTDVHLYGGSVGINEIELSLEFEPVDIHKLL